MPLGAIHSLANTRRVPEQRSRIDSIFLKNLT